MIFVIICALSASASVVTGAVSGSVFYLLIASMFATIGTIIQLIITHYNGYSRAKRKNGEGDR